MASHRHLGKQVLISQCMIQTGNQLKKIIISHPKQILSLRLPATSFQCSGLVNGGLYADVTAQCQMYHMCVDQGEFENLLDYQFYFGFY